MEKSNETFEVTYHISANSLSDAESVSEKIGVEQSVEMPLSALPGSAKKSLPETLLVSQIDDDRWKIVLSFPLQLVEGDANQFLNVLYGNISLYKGIKIVDISNSILENLFNGPSFGIEGIRNMAGIKKRPLSCTALKPVGLSPHELAERAYQFAMGGIDIIKDDHGLANQSSAGFKERVISCAEAIKRAKDKTGKRTLFFPNITTSAKDIFHNFELAIEAGADGVLVSPQLSGLSVLWDLAARAECPVMAHPAFSGAYVSSQNSGFTLDVFYGKLWRSMGADAIIYPNAGGRFPFSEDECLSLHKTCISDLCEFLQSFPVPAGGIQLSSIKKWIEFYGTETLFLVGGSLYTQKKGIKSAAEQFQKILVDYE